MKRATGVLLVAGGLSIFATVLIALLMVPSWAGLALPCLFGLVLGEVLLFGGFAWIEWFVGRAPHAFLRLGLSAVISIAALAICAISIAFFVMPLAGLGFFAALQVLVLLLLLMVLGCGAVILLGRGALERDGETRLSVSVNEERANALEEAASSCGSKEIAAALAGVADDIRFLDSSIEVPADKTIDGSIKEICLLAQGCPQDSNALEVAIRDLEGIVKVRKGEAAVRQRGGF